ncbi:MAG: alpha/beta hydrolase [Anaerolineae bacterium]|nr:alpha/beta hydrolase [Anaerolineae bacterium]
MSDTTRFRTPQDEARFMAAYDATLSLWNVEHQPLEITTSFGVTHVNVAGSPGLPPLVLLHGAQISSPVWYPNIKPLSSHFRVYAPDVVDQMGRSVPARRLKTPQDCANWLIELLDELHLDRIILIGHSQGGWLALNLATAQPERIERLVLLSPSGSLGRMRWQFLFHMLPVFIRPTKRNFYRAFQWMTTAPLGEHHPLAEQFMIGAQAYKPQELSTGVASRFSDEALQGLAMSTLLLIGDRDGTCKPHAELERARRLVPHLEAELIANGGHLFPVDQADATNTRILAFLKPEQADLH